MAICGINGFDVISILSQSVFSTLTLHSSQLGLFLKTRKSSCIRQAILCMDKPTKAL